MNTEVYEHFQFTLKYITGYLVKTVKTLSTLNHNRRASESLKYSFNSCFFAKKSYLFYFFIWC